MTATAPLRAREQRGSLPCAPRRAAGTVVLALLQLHRRPGRAAGASAYWPPTPPSPRPPSLLCVPQRTPRGTRVHAQGRAPSGTIPMVRWRAAGRNRLVRHGTARKIARERSRRRAPRRRNAHHLSQSVRWRVCKCTRVEEDLSHKRRRQLAPSSAAAQVARLVERLDEPGSAEALEARIRELQVQNDVLGEQIRAEMAHAGAHGRCRTRRVSPPPLVPQGYVHSRGGREVLRHGSAPAPQSPARLRPRLGGGGGAIAEAELVDLRTLSAIVAGAALDTAGAAADVQQRAGEGL